MPSAPKAPAAPEPARVECPCGIHREDCDYHRPSAAPTYEYGAYDVAPTPGCHSVVIGPGVYVYDASGALIEMPIGSILSLCIRGTVKL